MRRTFSGEERNGILRLALSQILLWSGLFYLFPGLLLPLEADLGWSRGSISLGITLSLAVWALSAPYAGRLVDRGAGAAMMTLGAVAATFQLLILSQIASYPAFLILCASIGLSMAATLYEPCFALLILRYGTRARAAISLVTLIAGFASMITFPLLAWLTATYGWRSAVLVFAGLAALAVVVLLIEQRRQPSARTQPSTTAGAPLNARVLVPLAVSFSLLALNHGLLLNHILPILSERRIPVAQAVFIVALIGPTQVFGRLLLVASGDRIAAISINAVSCAALFAASVLLFAAGSNVVLVAGFITLQGAFYGMTNILKPVVTADLFGHAGFGRVTGILALPFLLAFAVAPSLGSFLWLRIGYDNTVLLTSAMAAVSLAALFVARHRANSS